VATLLHSVWYNVLVWLLPHAMHCSSPAVVAGGTSWQLDPGALQLCCQPHEKGSCHAQTCCCCCWPGLL
jgi:hypothetical protein